MCVFRHVTFKCRCAKQIAEYILGLGKRPCNKNSGKNATPKLSFLIECDDYRKNYLWARREHEAVTGQIIERKFILEKSN
jgi:hypothetical protein